MNNNYEDLCTTHSRLSNKGITSDLLWFARWYVRAVKMESKGHMDKQMIWAIAHLMQ